ncbi:AP-3 complex subunit delta-1 [Apophysomyces sp. BC1034]|nr:AP-3 complex subunit delta-1 [Apophysomyces sp. BC1034]
MFEKSLTDLIRGIRANKKNEQKYIAVCLQEIRTEVKSNDADIKATAVAKLTYLQMLGYDMSWASFHIVEVMSSPKILQKRTGYLAATQSFQQDTDVLMLTTNLIKKDLASANALDISIAVNGLSHIVTADLARDLCQDLVAMLNHSRPYIRKKVVLVLYKVFLKFPEALRLSFPRLKEKLEDPDPSVVSAVVSVICELARKTPRNYLSLAPQLYKLLTTSSNNWMLIKVIKLFASLTPLEPRLIKKLLPPLTSLIQTTPAKSLLYECIYTVITGGFLEAAGDSSGALAATCADKLRTFLEDPDQNLKYVGLLAMGKMLSSHPKLVAEHKDIVLECIDDDDLSIRLRALDLIVGMVNRKNVVDIVKRLVAHLVPPSTLSAPSSLHEPSAILDPAYRADIINRIIFICSQNQYQNVTNFEWYITTLVGITYASGVNVGDVLTGQLMDVSVRVKSVRPFAVRQMFRLLSDKQFLETVKKRDSNIEVLSAAAWICGEYCNYLDDVPTTLECLLTPLVTKMPVKVQATYVHNIMKIYGFWVTDLIDQWNPELQGEFIKVTHVMREKMDMFAGSSDLEVQERAYNAMAIFDIILESASTSTESLTEAPLVLRGLPELFFTYELNPVAPKAQKKVPIPEGLDLDAWINEPLPDLIENADSDSASAEEDNVKAELKAGSKKKSRRAKAHNSDDEQEKEKRRAARREVQRNDPYYIMADKSEKKKKSLETEEDVELIPIVELSLDDLDLYAQSQKKGKKSKGSKRRQARITVSPPTIYAEEEMPENAEASASEDDMKQTKKSATTTYTKSSGRDIFATDDTGLHSVDLSTPLGDDEKFPQIQAYLSPEEVRYREEARAEVQRKAKKDAGMETKKKTKRKSTGVEKSSRATAQKSSEKPSKKDKKKKTKTVNVDKEEDKHIEEEQYTALVEELQHSVNDDDENPTTPTVLFSNEHVELTCTLCLEDNKGKEDTIPVVIATFSAKNKTEDLMLPSLHLEFVESFDMKLLEERNDSEVASVTETFELQHDEGIEFKGYCEVISNIRKGLCWRGNLQYDVEGSSTLHQYAVELSIPAGLFLRKDRKIDPAQFAALLAEHGEKFSYRGTAAIKVPITPDTPVEQALLQGLKEVARRSNLQVVEVVPCAASFYGESVQGVQVAGLLKCVLPEGEDVTSADITVDLKSTDDDFLEALIHELTTVC